MEPEAPSPSAQITQLLHEWQNGNEDALQRLMPLVYNELRRVARTRLRAEAPGHLLQTTALVHEAYLRLIDIERLPLRNRAHLLAVAAQLMRQILVDHARRRDAHKRGGELTIVPLEDVAAPAAAVGIDVLALHDALSDLAAFDPRMARVVELKFFGGLSIDEAAEALGVSHATIERDWTTARAWLHQRLTSSERPSS